MRTWSEPLGGPTPETEDWGKKSKTNLKKKKRRKEKRKRKETTSKVSSETVLRLLYSLEDFHYILTTLKCVNS